MESPIITLTQTTLISWFGVIVGLIVIIITAWINLKVSLAKVQITIGEMQLRIMSHDKELKETKNSIYSEIKETNTTLHRIEVFIARTEGREESEKRFKVL